MKKHGKSGRPGKRRRNMPGYYLGVNKIGHKAWRVSRRPEDIDKIVSKRDFLNGSIEPGSIFALSKKSNAIFLGVHKGRVLYYNPKTDRIGHTGFGRFKSQEKPVALLKEKAGLDYFKSENNWMNHRKIPGSDLKVSDVLLNPYRKTIVKKVGDKFTIPDYHESAVVGDILHGEISGLKAEVIAVTKKGIAVKVFDGTAEGRQGFMNFKNPRLKDREYTLVKSAINDDTEVKDLQDKVKNDGYDIIRTDKGGSVAVSRGRPAGSTNRPLTEEEKKDHRDKANKHIEELQDISDDDVRGQLAVVKKIISHSNKSGDEDINKQHKKIRQQLNYKIGLHDKYDEAETPEQKLEAAKAALKYEERVGGRDSAIKMWKDRIDELSGNKNEDTKEKKELNDDNKQKEKTFEEKMEDAEKIASTKESILFKTSYEENLRQFKSKDEEEIKKIINKIEEDISNNPFILSSNLSTAIFTAKYKAAKEELKKRNDFKNKTLDEHIEDLKDDSKFKETYNKQLTKLKEFNSEKSSEEARKQALQMLPSLKKNAETAAGVLKPNKDLFPEGDILSQIDLDEDSFASIRRNRLAYYKATMDFFKSLRTPKLNFSDLKLAPNETDVFEDEYGGKWKVKSFDDAAKAQNEVLLSSLYDLTDFKTTEAVPVLFKSDSKINGEDVSGKHGVAFKHDDNKKAYSGDDKEQAELLDSYAAHVWLSNWGVRNINDLTVNKDGSINYLDGKGSLLFNQNGLPNYEMLGGSVDDINNFSKNTIFEKMSDEQIINSMKNIVKIKNDDVKKAVEDSFSLYDGSDNPRLKEYIEGLADTLIKRKDYIALQLRELTREKQGEASLSEVNRVSDDDVVMISKSKADGVALKTDSNEIIDQQILFHHEINAEDVKQTVATFKLTDEGFSKIKELIKNDSSIFTGYERAVLPAKQIDADGNLRELVVTKENITEAVSNEHGNQFENYIEFRKIMEKFKESGEFDKYKNDSDFNEAYKNSKERLELLFPSSPSKTQKDSFDDILSIKYTLMDNSYSFSIESGARPRDPNQLNLLLGDLYTEKHRKEAFAEFFARSEHLKELENNLKNNSKIYLEGLRNDFSNLDLESLSAYRKNKIDEIYFKIKNYIQSLRGNEKELGFIKEHLQESIDTFIYYRAAYGYTPHDNYNDLAYKKVLDNFDVDDAINKVGDAKKIGDGKIEIGHYHVGEIDGVKIKIWSDEADTPFSIKNYVEIKAPGGDKESANKILSALDSLGINSKESTYEDKEELYLTKILKQRNELKRVQEDLDWRSKNTDEIKNQNDRIKFLKEALSKNLKIDDVTKLPNYNPEPVSAHQDGFGPLALYRPDLGYEDQQKWQGFKSTKALVHNPLYNNHDDTVTFAKRIKGMIEAGTTNLASAVDRLRRGFITNTGKTDMRTGGGDYVFTAIQDSNAKGVGFYWDMDEVQRLDSITYDKDQYGRMWNTPIHSDQHAKSTKADFVDSNRMVGVDGLISASGKHGNETLFKQNFSILYGLKKIVVPRRVFSTDIDQKKELIELFHKNGIKSLPNGIAIEDIIYES